MQSALVGEGQRFIELGRKYDPRTLLAIFDAHVIYFSARRKSVLGPTNVLPLYLIPAFKVSRFPGAIHQSFDSQKEAEIWLARKFSISWRMRVCGKALQTPYTPAERYRPQSQDRTMWRAKHTPRTPQPRMSREMALLNRIPIFPWFPHPRYGFLQNRI